MYNFHHGYIENNYSDKVKLLLAEIDILVHEIKTNDAFEDFSINIKV